jgi:hypothetical protein
MIGTLTSISCLIAIVFLFNKKLKWMEDRMQVTQEGELRRMLEKANGTISKLEKEAKQLKLIIEIDKMNEGA